jgi:Dehydrogenases with different specificities (related to short-chain alcohol dehydrogenases)
MSLFDLKGRVALVTGASSGLGKQFAETLANQGADIALLARRYEKLEETAKAIEQKGMKCLPVQCDVTDEAAVIAAIGKAAAHFGKIDILVNNAGLAIGGNAENLSGEDFKKVMDVNLNGVFYVAREVGKNMIKNNYGRIINIASIYGMVGNKYSPAISYHTTKGAIINFARGLAAEWAKYNITVNNIGPGFFHSEMTEKLLKQQSFLDYVKHMTCMERLGKPGELDTALLFLASDYSSYVTGQTVFVDGGWLSV